MNSRPDFRAIVRLIGRKIVTKFYPRFFFFFFLETNFLTNKEQMEFFLDFWKFLAIPIESLCNSLVIDFVQNGMESRN